MNKWKGKQLITLENLQQYHKLLIEYIGSPDLVPMNICPQCGGIISDTKECEYCSVKLKLVAEKEE